MPPPIRRNSGPDITPPLLMTATSIASQVAPASTDVGGAVGVQPRQWFVAIVNNNSEKLVREKLTRLGYTAYVATQDQVKLWANGRRARVEQVVIRTAVFIHCTETQRRQAVKLPFIKRFLTNRAAASQSALAVVPDVEMHMLRFILGNSDTPVTISDAPLRRGDSVKVIRGALAGLSGEILDTDDGNAELLIRLDILGCARLTIDRLNVAPL